MTYMIERGCGQNMDMQKRIFPSVQANDFRLSSQPVSTILCISSSPLTISISISISINIQVHRVQGAHQGQLPHAALSHLIPSQLPKIHAHSYALWALTFLVLNCLYQYIVALWLARPSHLITGALRAWRDGLAAVTIGSHLFSTNQMLLAGIPANSIHSLPELNHALESWISSIVRCMVRLNYAGMLQRSIRYILLRIIQLARTICRIINMHQVWV